MPQAAKPTVEQIREMQVSAALDEAVKISEEYEALIKRRKANRTELRQLQDMGHVHSNEDAALIAELYPARVRSDEPDDAAENGDKPAE